MKVYGYTYTETNYSASYSSKANRDVVVRGAPNVHLWEYDIPDDVVEPPGEDTPPPTTFGSVIEAKVALDSRTGPATIVLARVGDSEFPWVGIDPRHDSTNAWISSVIQSWKPVNTGPSADTLSTYLFEEFSLVLDEDQERDLRDFLANP